MQLQVTTASTNGGPGRRYPSNPPILGAVFRNFLSNVADTVFVDPSFDSRARFFNVITKNAQVIDVGVALIVQMVKQSDGTPLDVSEASDLEVIIGIPGGIRFIHTAALLTDGVDGKIYYITVDTDLPTPGIYSIQGKATIGSTILRSAVQFFEVKSNIERTSPGPIPDDHVGTFTQVDLVDGIFTINHYKGLDAPYAVNVIIFDQDGHQITPDQITGFTNSVEIDLTSFAPISGTWGYVYT